MRLSVPITRCVGEWWCSAVYQRSVTASSFEAAPAGLRAPNYRSQVFAPSESSYVTLAINDGNGSAWLLVASAFLPGEKRSREEESRPQLLRAARRKLQELESALLSSCRK